MSEPRLGRVTWQDLTVPDADRVRDFYSEVVGWRAQNVDMGGYEDYAMHAPDGECVSGVCWQRGVNAALPPQWLIYVTVADVDAAAARCAALGGRVLDGPRAMGERRFCVIQDPAGAALGLISPE